jgi:hypothetical protein
MMPMRLALLTALSVFAALPAYSDDIDRCPLPKNGKSTTALTDLPPLLRRLSYGLGRRDGPLATDALQHYSPPTERLFRAFNLGRRWVLVEQQGGFSMQTKLVVYALSKRADLAMLITDHPKQVTCRAILLSLQPSPNDY